MEIPFRNIINKFFDVSEDYGIINRCLEIEAKDISIVFAILIFRYLPIFEFRIHKLPPFLKLSPLYHDSP
jgi:hypothetical protein